MHRQQSTPPRFKVQYANADLEQPLATYTLGFKLGDYTLEETFIVVNQTSLPIIVLAFLRKHAAILDTAQGTIDFPKIQITMGITDEMQKHNPKLIKTESKNTIPAHACRAQRHPRRSPNFERSNSGQQSGGRWQHCSRILRSPAGNRGRIARLRY